MLLTLDFGNSTIKFGLFDNDKMIYSCRINYSDSFAEIAKTINQKSSKNKINSILYCSVVPQKSSRFLSQIKKYWASEIKDLGVVIIKILPLKIDNPQTVGSDRLIGSWAAGQLYGYPVIEIDCGTALTFNVINSEGIFIGGIIAPGLPMLLKSLTQTTEQLPALTLEEIQKYTTLVWGKNTVEAMAIGCYSNIYFSMLETIKKLKDKLSKTYHKSPKIIMTGGWGEFFAKKIEMVDIYEPNLILKGLNLLYHQEIK